MRPLSIFLTEYGYTQTAETGTYPRLLSTIADRDTCPHRAQAMPPLLSSFFVLVRGYDPSRASVGDSDRGRAGGDGGQNTAVLLHVDDGRARGGGRAARGASRHTSEGDGAPVGEGDEASALREVLDDPLRVLLAERGLAGERVRDRLAGGVVDDRRRPAGARRRGHGHGDRVSGADRDAREVVRKVGEPLEPG